MKLTDLPEYTPENVALLKKMPKSKLSYYVKAETTYPSGDRNLRCSYDKPQYVLMRRCVGPDGMKDRFYSYRGKMTAHEIYRSCDKEHVEAICFQRNFNFHHNFLSTGSFC